VVSLVKSADFRAVVEQQVQLALRRQAPVAVAVGFLGVLA
jgi:hypothetical protein